MNSVIICEGGTDGTLLQYFMEKVNGWHYSAQKKGAWSHLLEKDKDTLEILASGGCSNIPQTLERVLARNKLSQPGSNEVITKIVLLTDRDEAGTEKQFIDNITNTLNAHDKNNNPYLTSPVSGLKNNQWATCEMQSRIGLTVDIRILIMVIPFQDEYEPGKTGALETFLLNAREEESQDDKKIIVAGNDFIEKMANEQKTYLTHRRERTKAKFDVYFSIATAIEQFTQRRNILKSIPWEKYTTIQNAFSLLQEI